MVIYRMMKFDKLLLGVLLLLFAVPMSAQATFPARSAVCFEAQCFPDTPNKAHFPSAVLLPGDEYQQITIYKFGVQE